MGFKALLLIATFLMTSYPVYSLSCLPCSQVQCIEPVNCKGGVVDSVCGCCKVCAKVEGEMCGGLWNTEGRCDTGLACVVRDRRKDIGLGFCEPVMCKRKRCGIHEVCTLGVNGLPKCTCIKSCNHYLNKPVCGYHNGKQYNNKCELYKDECHSGSDIGLMQGPCKRCFHGGRTFRFGETRRGKSSCEECRCFHGEWKCTVESDCPQVSTESCSVSPDVNGRTIQSSCPKGYKCKVQIPGIPEANIPDVAVCVPGNPSDGDRPVTEAHPSTPARLTDGDKRDKIPFQCLFDPDDGPCRAAFQRWYYDKTRGKCVAFLYGGCEGNANNFYTKTACKNFCVLRNRTAAAQMPRQTPVPPPENVLTQEPLPLWKEACRLPPATGPCRASFHRWYYNHSKRKCSKFTYGGCNGNVNNFRTKDECKKRCMRKKVYPTTTVSSLPPFIAASVNSANTFFCRCTQCWGQDRCSTSVGCFSVINRDVKEGGMTKGCFYKSEEYLSQCGQNQDQTRQNTMECCKKDMCNDFVVSEDSSKQSHPTIDTNASPSPKPLASIVKCHDSPSNKFYGEGESWEPNDCTVCVCRNGIAECLATVCRHPDCREPLYIKGQCCPVCPLISNSSDHSEAALIKAFADNKLDTVLVSINHGHQRDVCRDIRSGQMYLVGQSWQLDHCTTCYCGKSGKAACAVQMCERDPQCKNLVHDQNDCCPMCKDDHVVRSTSQCYDTVTQKYYREAELWQRDECTSCYCGSDRKPACTNTMCPPLECDAPLKIEKRCCLICPDTIKQGCMYDGKKFLHGDLKLLSDQCTLCKCENGDWHCSKNSCHA